MVRQHLGRGSTEEQRVALDAAALRLRRRSRAAHRPEFRSAFVAYLEWGSRIAVVNSQPGEEPVVEQPMPKWGWGEPGGPWKP